MTYPIPVDIEGSFNPSRDPFIHTDDRPFCPSSDCGCHEDADAIAEVNFYYEEGFLSAEDATRIVKGGNI